MATSAEAPPAVSSPRLGARERADRFCQRFGLQVPILQAPMAGACPGSSSPVLVFFITGAINQTLGRRWRERQMG